MIPWKDMSKAEKAAYVLANVEDMKTHIEAIAKAKIRRYQADTTPGEEAQIDLVIIRLTHDKALIQAKYDARKSTGILIVPPTPEEIAEAKRRADATAQLIVDRDCVTKAVEFAKAALEFQQKTQHLP
ncbi:hypothetical protein [Gimibacter soli]|uniref:Uncharacterized protein n=1 Tax=Gimibacter soli TaxID=3024400 RepID=A0AAF0BLU0_9PROT|nr:hypothetical protein [Gimibacter soli]WCL53865.1 hypothetical protein PH603_15105 [Gimibacter soli]